MNEKEEIIKTEISKTANAPLRKGGNDQFIGEEQESGGVSNPNDIDDKTANEAESLTMYNLYQQLNKLFGGSQLFVMEYPTRGLNQLDYAYKIEDYNSSSILKPYVIAENEFRLTDGLMDLAPIVQGTNGKSLATEYQTVINNFAPRLNDIVGFITDKMELRMFLLETITDKIGDQEYTCSRMEFCQKLYLHYLKQKADWDQEKFEKNKKAVEENTLNEYAAWLATTAWTKDKELEALFNDAIVRGFYHEIMTILGFIDVASPAERLEKAKTNLRTSVRRRIDGSGEVYPVSLSPSDWFRALTPNYSPKDLLTDAEFLTTQYLQKKKTLTALKRELRLLLSQNIDPEQIKDIEKEINAKRKEIDNCEMQLASDNGEAAVKMAKLALEMVSKGNMSGFLAGKAAKDIPNALKLDVINKMLGNETDDEKVNENNKNKLFGIVESLAQSYKDNIEYFKAYEDLMNLKLTEAKYQTADRQESISILLERIKILSDEVSQLEIILASGFENKEETSDTTNSGESTESNASQKPSDVDTPMLPDNRYDGDNMFTEVIISKAKDATFSNTNDSSLTANLAGSFSHFLFHASANASYSSSTHDFTKKMNSSSVQIGMRVMKVSIERGGWFDPGIMDISSSFMHIRESIKASNGHDPKYYYGDSRGNPAVDNSVLPGFPAAFLIAKDIHIKVDDMSFSNEEFQSFQKASVNASTSMFGFRLSGGAAMQKNTKKDGSKTVNTGVSIKIPGPQILGWFMQLTPEDNSKKYVQLSQIEDFDKIIDSLKGYRQKMNEMKN